MTGMVLGEREWAIDTGNSCCIYANNRTLSCCSYRMWWKCWSFRHVHFIVLYSSHCARYHIVRKGWWKCVGNTMEKWWKWKEWISFNSCRWRMKRDDWLNIIWIDDVIVNTIDWLEVLQNRQSYQYCKVIVVGLKAVPLPLF